MKLSFNTFLLLSVIALLGLGACTGDVIDETPQSVARFITQYFPNQSVKSYTATADGGHKAELDNSATIIFNSSNEWIEIDGEGVTLPEVLLYDQLPPALYSYLQATEQQHSVYAMARDNFYYKLTMHDTVITYTISTGAITYPGELPDSKTE